MLGPGNSTLTPTIVDPPRMPARVATVRRQFDQRAARFAAHDVAVREIERRLIERLDVIRLDPRQIVDVGCGAGASQTLLAARYPRARWLGIDLSLAMLRQGRGPGAGWAQRLAARLPGRAGSRPLVCADGGALPLAADSADLLLSNLMLHWHPEPHTVFPEWRRALRDGGLLLFSCFGPDTVKELRAACAAALPQARAVPLVDMHDFGDMLVASGFATPVMDVEVLRLTYPSARALLREAAALGGNPRDDRPRGLPGTAQARALLDALSARAQADGRIALTLEVAYGHAWKAPMPLARDAQAVPLSDLRAQLAARRPR